jgi:purine-binding chemotaxis protein CheW
VTTGYVLFRLGERVFATSLDDVREIVRLTGLETLPGTRPPLAGVLVLRGTPLPVLDVRGDGASDAAGDVLVMDADSSTLGVAVDGVVAVLRPDELPAADAPARALPGYVVGVRKRGGIPVLLVDLRLLLDTMSVGWVRALEETTGVVVQT